MRTGVNKLYARMGASSSYLSDLRDAFRTHDLSPLKDIDIEYVWETGMWVDGQGTYYTPEVVTSMINLPRVDYWNWVVYYLTMKSLK